jgi:hypothetical protein
VLLPATLGAALQTLQGLLWFKSPPRYYARWTRSAAAEQVASLQQFLRQLKQVLTVTQGTWPSAFAGGDAGGPGGAGGAVVGLAGERLLVCVAGWLGGWVDAWVLIRMVGGSVIQALYTESTGKAMGAGFLLGNTPKQCWCQCREWLSVC